VARRYWLMKSEPDVFSWDHLLNEPDRTTCWDGVRNYQARNFLRDEISVGDGVLFYHSSTNPTAVVGTAKVVRAGYADPTQFNRRSKYHDPKSAKDNPRWFAVDIKADKTLKRAVTLKEMREKRGLEKMKLIQRGMRLSVMPVTTAEWKIITKLGGL
jgi:predicted RNA-binding protein with PUA-like domain